MHKHQGRSPHTPQQPQQHQQHQQHQHQHQHSNTMSTTVKTPSPLPHPSKRPTTTPVKSVSPSSSSSISSFLLPSPRLRSPRGSPNHHRQVTSGVCCFFYAFRNFRGIFLLALFAAFWSIRSPMDAAATLGTSLLLDPSIFDISASSAPTTAPTSAPVETRTTTTATATPTNTPVQVADTVASNVSSSVESTDEDSNDATPPPPPPSSSSTQPPNTTTDVTPTSGENHSPTSGDNPNSNNITRSITSLLASYSPSKYPIFKMTNSSSPPIVDVHLVVDGTLGASATTASKSLFDGLARSPYTNIVDITFLKPTINHVNVGKRRHSKMVWIVDWGSMNRDCHRLERVQNELSRKSDQLVLLVDYSGSTRIATCDFWDKNTRLAKRSIVEGRHYNHDQKQIQLGTIRDNTEHVGGGHVVHAPLLVRERFAEAIRSMTPDGNNPTAKSSSRGTDVCFFWKKGDYSHYGFWRRDVSTFIEKLGKSSSKYKTLVDIVANDEEGMEVGNIQLDYVKALLNCKIVVLAQRDEWEDHYRLYESLASGALVMMDSMLVMPDGLKNKTNVAVYDSLDSLQQLIPYYLEHSDRRNSVARRGMELAMGRYRSWHRIEQLLFGMPLTNVDMPYEKAPAKKTRLTFNFLEGEAILPIS